MRRRLTARRRSETAFVPRLTIVASPPPRKSRTLVRLLAFGSVPLLLIAVGTVGYHAIEGWPWFDALYMAVITLTSVGVGDKRSLSATGRVFTMTLALGGIFTVAIAATEILAAIITGEL